MDGQERQGLGARLSERLLRRTRVGARLRLADTLLARFGVFDDWGGKLLTEPVRDGDAEGMVTLSIQPYLRRLRRLAWARRRREGRLAQLQGRFALHTRASALRRLPGAEVESRTAAARWWALGEPGVLSSSEMVLPEPAVARAAPVEVEPAAAPVGRGAAPARGGRGVSSPWLQTPWSGARVIRGGRAPTDAGGEPAKAAAGRSRGGRSSSVSALQRAGQRADAVRASQDPVARQIEAAAPMLSRTRRGRAIARELVELVELPPQERAVRVRRLVRRAGAVVRPVVEEVEARVPDARVTPVTVAAGRMPERGGAKPARGLRPVMASSPVMQPVRPAIPV
ncbi:MAG: hypothetical protein D6798_08390, partial [Deltaproteobacteria bacterium]